MKKKKEPSVLLNQDYLQAANFLSAVYSLPVLAPILTPRSRDIILEHLKGDDSGIVKEARKLLAPREIVIKDRKKKGIK